VKLLFGCVSCLFPLFLFAGPFGFEIGKAIGDYPDVVFEKIEACNTCYQVKNVPAPNKLMELYSIRHTIKSGICFIKGLSKNIETSKYGVELNIKYNSVFQSLDNKYKSTHGKEKINFLASGSIWNEPGDYMMALLKKERYMYTQWQAKDSSNKILKIFLLQNAINQEKGYLTIEYYGNNKKDCDAEDSADEADGF
jgi:hypothetical protein